MMAMRLHKVVSRYLRSNICYELSEPYQPKPNEDWDVLERKGKQIQYVKAAAIAFPSVSGVQMNLSRLSDICRVYNCVTHRRKTPHVILGSTERLAIMKTSKLTS